jgi:hypothetical protein
LLLCTTCCLYFLSISSTFTQTLLGHRRDGCTREWDGTGVKVPALQIHGLRVREEEVPEGSEGKMTDGAGWMQAMGMSLAYAKSHSTKSEIEK